jgi:diguanylate cyclase (GGDEF)-like protein
MSVFQPIFAAMLVVLVAVILGTNTMSYRLILSPLDKLVSSLARLKENKDERIYGIERDDEFGNLSNTIQDLFTKANYDALTGIYNRRYLDDTLERTLNNMNRTGDLLSLLYVDVDHFKVYNDVYGPDAGDECLIKLAEALKTCLFRGNDFVARTGGEEFMVVLPHTPEKGARLVADRMLEGVRALMIPHTAGVSGGIITISIGIVTGMRSPTRWLPQDFFLRADEALRQAKDHGRNRYAYLGLSSQE